MRLQASIFVLTVAGFALAIPTSGFADDKNAGEPAAGGAAAEHRTDQAGESSNAQWSKDATKGQERSGERSHAQPKATDKTKGKAKHTATEKHGAAKSSTTKHMEKQGTATHTAPKHSEPKHGATTPKVKAGQEGATKGSEPQ